MKKTIRSSLFLLALFLLAKENVAQVTANAQQPKGDAANVKGAKEKKLKEILTELKDHYNVDILFFDRYVDYNVPADVIRWDKSIEKNLEEILKATNLEFRKTRTGGFIISPKKISQVDLDESQGTIPDQNPSSNIGKNLFQAESLSIPGAASVTGIVKDDSGQSLSGANVVEKGTANGTTTDADGKYTIVVQENATLVFSFIGFVTIEEAVAGRSVIDVSLKLDIKALSEVVVVGYGEMRRSDITSAQTTISSKDISHTINTTLDQAIQGRAAGVYVTQNTGAPGGGVSVNIRGVNSINGTNEPLYVVDGVQIQGSTSLTGTNPLSSLNPSDIESIEILQGPNATAIYGSRATNGVVLITTKRGKSGEMKITYNYMYSLQDRQKDLDVMNLTQYAQLHF